MTETAPRARREGEATVEPWNDDTRPPNYEPWHEPPPIPGVQIAPADDGTGSIGPIDGAREIKTDDRDPRAAIINDAEWPHRSSPAIEGGLSPHQVNAKVEAAGEHAPGSDLSPAQLRHQANMERLRIDAASGQDQPASQRLLERIEASQSGVESQRLLLLGFEPRTDRSDAKVIVANGNPDTADNVVIYIPGANTNVAGIDKDLNRMRDLKLEVEETPDSGRTSTIVWLGYDSPNNILVAGTDRYARDGVAALHEFTNDLRDTHIGPRARMTLIGYSYGSVMLGTAAAAARGLPVDNIIVVGSPGLGYLPHDKVRFQLDENGVSVVRQIQGIEDIHINPDRFWVLAAADDPVVYVDAHGPNPVRFGQRVAVGNIHGHHQYWEPGSVSLRNQARIVIGYHRQVTRIAGEP